LIVSAPAQNQFFNLNQINASLRREIKNAVHKDGKSKQTKSYEDDDSSEAN